ncbi:hypothetical protein Q1695_012804 [Nippostrongylus brasiliensis]|nr:hypothetical protein Q1695_012804 [Nippostrongylus brasiliensis]
MPEHHAIVRCVQESGEGCSLPYLPDEIIAHIISSVSPTEIITYGWVGVSTGFDELVRDFLRKCTTLNACEDFIWHYLRPYLLSGTRLPQCHGNLLRLLMERYFHCVHDFVVPIALFTEMHSVLESCYANDPKRVAMPLLDRITIHIGQDWGKLVVSHYFDNLKISKVLCHRLSEVNLDIEVSDVEAVTCCGFRLLVRYLLEVTDSDTVWNLTMEDSTSNGQGYHGPADLNRLRDKAFISYVRVLLDLGLIINRLTLLDRRKVSPYMMIMSLNKRRSIYMYPEFKRCHELFVCYDIGLIAPIFAHENDRFTSLRVFEVDESHVLYKTDLLEYLSNAPMHSVLESCYANDPKRVAMPLLDKITIHIGQDWGKLVVSHYFDNLKISKALCHRLSEVNLDIEVSDVEAVTCCGFRLLVRYLLEVADSDTVWNLTMEDSTSNGQGYHGPADLNRLRDKAFISYVRVLLDLGLTINRLTLLDRRKVSPYMMIMSLNKRRSIYMYPEFKRCHELFVCYDIGLIAPIFAHENDRFTSLRVFEVDESHVLYKTDLLEYLSNAPNLCEMRVVVPATWSRRVSSCTKGCFTRPDFACFR